MRKAKHCWCEHAMSEAPDMKGEKACGHDYTGCDKMHHHHKMHHQMEHEMEHEMHCEMNHEMEHEAEHEAEHEMHMEHMHHHHEMPECETDAKMPECLMLAHAYAPWQVYENAFCPGEALMKGTLFPELWGVYPIPR